jgi:hypothetical protein
MVRTSIVFAAWLSLVACGNVEKQPDDDGNPTDCTPGAATCANDVAIVCSAAGTVESTQSCSFGCASSNDRCSDLAPSNALDAELDMSGTAPEIVLSGLATPSMINTDTGDVTHNGAPIEIPSTVKMQTGAPPIRVFRVRSLMIGNEIVVTGANGIAIVSDGDVVISSEVHVAARWQTPGPGAFVGASPCNGADATVADPTGTTTRVPGAGGGGLGTAGGKGGNAAKGTTISPGLAGGAIAGTVDLQPLRGGCRGGNMLSTDAYWVHGGGGGGGAIQISSRGQITVTASGVIDAGGGGATFGKSGTGGGSGGAILLEARAVTIEGRLAANGGAGTCFNFEGENGRTAYGTDGLLGAAGGNCTEANGIGDGGIGASKDNAPGDGGLGSSTTAVPIGGGGGGSVGRVRINTRTGTVAKGASSLITPLASEATIRMR